MVLLSSFLFVVLIVMEIGARSSRRIYAKEDVAGIRRYMHEWIEHGSRVAIWTRDMSWAQTEETRRLLAEKARRNELILCLPERNEFVSDLERKGAEVCIYGSDMLESPAARFTITLFGRDGSRVAIGRADGDAHVIVEFTVGEHPAYHVAADLVALVRAMQRR